MSAKNRKCASQFHDRYVTPVSLARAAFEMLYGRFGKELYGARRFLEPAAGPGVFCKLAKQYGKGFEDVVGVELYSTKGATAAGYRLIKTDFLKWTPMDKKRFDLSVCNPPFTYAADFIRHNYDLMKSGGYMVYLGRIGLLGSLTRRALWNAIPLKEIWLCRPRPRFTDGGSDATEYAFYVIQKQEGLFTSTFHWLDWD